MASTILLLFFTFYLDAGATVLIILDTLLSPCTGGLFVQWQQLYQLMQSATIHRHVTSEHYFFQLLVSYFLNHIDFEQSPVLDELLF